MPKNRLQKNKLCATIEKKNAKSRGEEKQ